MEDFIIKDLPEYIFFLQHPEKTNHYLIIQDAQYVFDDLYAQFNRTGIYTPGNPVTMPHNKVKFIEKITVPDKNLFGLLYFICHESGDMIYKEDDRIPYGDWGWFIINGDLQINKWLKDYSQQKELKKQQAKTSQKTETIQTSLF